MKYYFNVYLLIHSKIILHVNLLKSPLLTLERHILLSHRNLEIITQFLKMFDEINNGYFIYK